MAITVEGDYPPIERIPTGLFSLDMALATQNDMGMPVRCLYEMYGYTGAGKSSLDYYLAGKVNPKGTIELCDLEGLDRDYVLSSLNQAGFEGTLHFISSTNTEKKKVTQRTHEAMMQELVTNLQNDKSSCSILDSVGAIVPIAEDSGDIGDANMGRRAKAVAQMVRGLTRVLKYMELPKIAFVVNHVNAVIGGRGHVTPGGDTLKFLSQVRIMIKPGDVIRDSEDNPLAFISEGSVEKLRFGAKGRKFKFVILPGIGVSPDLTAMVDCITLGLAKREATVKLNGESVGKIGRLVDDASKGRHDSFIPFYEALDDYKRNSYGIAIPDMGGDDEGNGTIEEDPELEKSSIQEGETD
jgi:RecA/RadA recombinase